MEQTDLLVIGGGINGAGIARDAAGRGLSVVLAEADDLAGATSSSSSKLIHGGLRYLEHGAFRLVREALGERAVLLRIAPHIAWPMRFVLPQDRGMRPAWLIRLGLLLYDHLGARGPALPGTRRIDLRTAPEGAPLQPRFRTAFEYADAWVDDARLVVLNAVDAAARGASIRTRTRCTALHAESGAWIADLAGTTLRARAVVNAAGPWVGEILHRQAGLNAGPATRLVKGSHIVVPRLHDGPQAYILQNDDRRVVFVLPYETDFSLIGTTDTQVDHPSDAHIDPAEIDYLCRAVSRAFRRPVTPSDVVHTFSGIRPLYDTGEKEAAAVTRDYKLHLDTTPAPLLSVFGGKITTYRRLAEHALELLLPHLSAPKPTPWTATAPLPGGDLPFDQLLAQARSTHPDLPETTLHRLAHAYGTRLHQVLATPRGAHFGADLYENELRYLTNQEWAQTADDILWRRTKLGLRLTADQAERLRNWIATHA